MNASVAKWLERLVAEPVRAVDDLVMGRVAIPVWSRASLGEIFLDIVEVQAEALDAGVAEWLASHLRNLPPDGFSNEVWGSYLQDLFRAVTSLSLPRVARLKSAACQNRDPQQTMETGIHGHCGNLQARSVAIIALGRPITHGSKRRKGHALHARIGRNAVAQRSPIRRGRIGRKPIAAQ